MLRLFGVTHDDSLGERNGDMLLEARHMLHTLLALDTNGELTTNYDICVTHIVL